MDSTDGKTVVRKVTDEDDLLVDSSSTAVESSTWWWMFGKRENTSRMTKEADLAVSVPIGGVASVLWTFSARIGRSAGATLREAANIARWMKNGTEAGRPGEAVAEAGKAVMDMNSDSFTGEEAGNELRKRLEKMGIRPEMQPCADEDYFTKEIWRALLDVQDKLVKKKKKKKKNNNEDKETFQLLLPLLRYMSSKLDQGGDDEKDEIEWGKSAMEEYFDANDATMDSTMTMLESDIEPATDPIATRSMTIQDDHDLEMSYEEEEFALHRRKWESNWSKTCGSFKDITVMSSLQFTHHTPGLIPYGSAGSMVETLQICSIKLADIVGGLEWPLSVYGMVAARDIVDHNRNIIFFCSRSEAQELKLNDPFLHLFGPSRAIVSTEKVDFEFELKVKGAADSEDKPLITCACGYNGLPTMCFKNILCTLELCSQPVKRTVQATILGVRVVKRKESWPQNFEYGGIVACSPLSGKFVFSDTGFTRKCNPSSNQIVLLDSKDGPMPEGASGHLHLWRQVVSVDFEGGLDFVIQSYSQSGGIAAENRVHFMPKKSNISQQKFALDDAQVTITVAWSLVPTDKDEVVLEVGRRRWVA